MAHLRNHRLRWSLAAVAATAVLLGACSGPRGADAGAPDARASVPADALDTLDAAIGLDTLAGWPAVVRVAVDAAGVDAYSAGGPLSGSQELCDVTVLESITGTFPPGTPLTVTCSARGVAGGLTDEQAAAAYGLPPYPPTPGAQVGYALTPLPGAPGRWATRKVNLEGAPSVVGPGTPTTSLPRISVQSGGATESMTIDEFRALAAASG